MGKLNAFMEGSQIYLRPLKLSDVNQNYLTWLSDPEVMNGIATSNYDISSLKTYVEDKITDENVHFLAIIFKEKHLHIGNIKFDFYDVKANVAELGLLIGNKQYWGRGIAKEACQLMINYAFDSLLFRKIYLAVYENNVAAFNLYKSLGFKIEGRLINHVSVNGKYYDKFLMGMFNEKLNNI